MKMTRNGVEKEWPDEQAEMLKSSGWLPVKQEQPEEQKRGPGRPRKTEQEE